MAWVNMGNVFLPDTAVISNAGIIYDFCVNTLGFNHITTIGLLGNMAQESRCNPWMTQSLSQNPSLGIGLNQWTPWSVLNNRLSTLGLPIGNTSSTAGDNQLTVFQNEMNNRNNGSSVFGQWFDIPSENVSWTNLINTTSINESVRQWLRGYYRAGIPALTARQNWANRFDSIFENGTTNNNGGTQLAVLPVRNYTPGLTMTQGPGGSFSHTNVLAMDFAYPVTQVDYYAPCDVVCMFVDVPNATVVWNSTGPVKQADGTVGPIAILCTHDNNIGNFSVGMTRAKGQVLGATGVAGNATGDHLHLEVSRVPLASGENPYFNYGGTWGIRSQNNIYDVFSICDNLGGNMGRQINIINGMNFPWRCLIHWNDGSIGGNKDLIVLGLVDALPILGYKL